MQHLSLTELLMGKTLFVLFIYLEQFGGKTSLHSTPGKELARSFSPAVTEAFIEAHSGCEQ